MHSFSTPKSASLYVSLFTFEARHLLANFNWIDKNSLKVKSKYIFWFYFCRLV